MGLWGSHGLLGDRVHSKQSLTRALEKTRRGHHGHVLDRRVVECSKGLSQLWMLRRPGYFRIKTRLQQSVEGPAQPHITPEPEITTRALFRPEWINWGEKWLKYSENDTLIDNNSRKSSPLVQSPSHMSDTTLGQEKEEKSDLRKLNILLKVTISPSALS